MGRQGEAVPLPTAAAAAAHPSTALDCPASPRLAGSPAHLEPGNQAAPVAGVDAQHAILAGHRRVRAVRRHRRRIDAACKQSLNDS